VVPAGVVVGRVASVGPNLAGIHRAWPGDEDVRRTSVSGEFIRVALGWRQAQIFAKSPNCCGSAKMRLSGGSRYATVRAGSSPPTHALGRGLKKSLS
jgi:hypothetical protein